MRPKQGHEEITQAVHLVVHSSEACTSVEKCNVLRSRSRRVGGMRSPVELWAIRKPSRQDGQSADLIFATLRTPMNILGTSVDDGCSVGFGWFHLLWPVAGPFYSTDLAAVNTGDALVNALAQVLGEVLGSGSVGVADVEVV